MDYRVDKEDFFLEVTSEMIEKARDGGKLDFELVMDLAEITLDTGILVPGLYRRSYRELEDNDFVMEWSRV